MWLIELKPGVGGGGGGGGGGGLEVEPGSDCLGDEERPLQPVSKAKAQSSSEQ